MGFPSISSGIGRLKISRTVGAMSIIEGDSRVNFLLERKIPLVMEGSKEQWSPLQFDLFSTIISGGETSQCSLPGYPVAFIKANYQVRSLV